MFGNGKINHIGINCQDVEKVSTFFVKHFEAKISAKYHNPRTGLHSVMLALSESSARIELMNWPDMELHQQSAHMQGLVHLSIGVGNKETVDNLTARLVSDGYQCTSGPRTTGDGYYESSIIGPENLNIEITV